MAKRIENIPSPDVLMNSMRSMGYSFKSAIADIIDNSISAFAKNIEIIFPTNSLEEPYVAIIDDGCGMDDNELFNAMKYGSVKENYSEFDLGRYGLGLKSASLSQCRVLTVISKKNNVYSCFRWDLDDVLITKKWECLKLEKNEYERLVHFDKLNKLDSGTLVLWQNFDVAYKKFDGNILSFLSEEMFDAEEHIKLTYHRFLNAKDRINIYINNVKLIGYDPFLEEYRKHPKLDCRKPQELDEGVIIQQYILPHQVDLSRDDIDALGGMDAIRDQQGFFVYRNNRLIIHSTWFKLAAKNISPELYKYGRIKVDIPNSMDDVWEIDIKKQNAVVPRKIINMLKNAVGNVCRKSTNKTTKRARLTTEINDDHLWSKSLTRENKDVFFINQNSKFIRNFLDDFDDKDKTKILRLLDVISQSIPYDDIYNSVCQKNQNTEIDKEILDSIIQIGLEQINHLMAFRQIDLMEAYKAIIQYEPFNDEMISHKLMEAMLDE